jgi:hypothetical protein
MLENIEYKTSRRSNKNENNGSDSDKQKNSYQQLYKQSSLKTTDLE